VTRYTQAFAITESIIATYTHSRPVMGMPSSSNQLFTAPTDVTAPSPNALTFSDSPSPSCVNHVLRKCHKAPSFLVWARYRQNRAVARGLSLALTDGFQKVYDGVVQLWPIVPSNRLVCVVYLRRLDKLLPRFLKTQR
jgi:hypothetical protein